MNRSSSPTTISLQPGQPLLLKRVAGARVSAVSGCVWITQYGDPADIVLRPGQSIELALPTATVMSAAHGAVLTLSGRSVAPARAPWWRRLLGVFDPRWSGAVRRGLCQRLPMVTPQMKH
jgi:hypothetical protein